MNPEVIEDLKVQLGTSKDGKETVRLGDIAQVVPRGRMLNVVCGEEAVRFPLSRLPYVETPCDSWLMAIEAH